MRNRKFKICGFNKNMQSRNTIIKCTLNNYTRIDVINSHICVWVCVVRTHYREGERMREKGEREGEVVSCSCLLYTSRCV